MIRFKRSITRQLVESAPARLELHGTWACDMPRAISRDGATNPFHTHRIQAHRAQCMAVDANQMIRESNMSNTLPTPCRPYPIVRDLRWRRSSKVMSRALSQGGEL